jgi:hypothetical protein
MTLYGVSDIVPSHPAWHAEGLRWREAFDRIDLGDIREQARRNKAAVPQRHGISSALHHELPAIFDPTNEVQLTRTEESSVPIDNDLIYGTRAIATYLELPIQKCRDLISLGGIPTFTMPGSSTRWAWKSSLNATWRAGGTTGRLGGVIWMRGRSPVQRCQCRGGSRNRRAD